MIAIIGAAEALAQAAAREAIPAEEAVTELVSVIISIVAQQDVQ